MQRAIIPFILALLIIGACSNDLMNEGSIIIQAPESYSFGDRGLYGTTDQIALSSLSQENFRFEIIARHKENRVAYALLKNGDEASLIIPAGLKLDFYAGVYYAENSTTNDEEYNVYLAADSKKGVYFMPGESRLYDFVIDLSRPPRVNTNYGTNMGPDGISAITGGYIDGSSSRPYFSTLPLVTGGSPDSKMIRFLSGDVTPDDATFSLNLNTLGYSGRGNVFDVGVGFNRMWFACSSGIYWDDFGTWYADSSSSFNSSTVLSLLPNINYAEGINIDAVMMAGNPEYYYFLSYGQGFIGVADTYESSWTTPVNVDFSSFALFYPGEEFLLDMESYSNYRVLWATKIGLFLIDNVTLRKYNFGDRLGAIEGSKRRIKLSDPENSSLQILVKKVRVGPNYIYLGTRKGLYRINKNSSAWTSFAGGSGYGELDQSAIEKISSFDHGPVTTLDVFSTVHGTVVAVSTPKGVWFKNLSSNKSDFITVMDGLPFIPYKSFTNPLFYNVKDHFPHEAAPINHILWDSVNDKFWIGTDYGLASIYYNRLNL